MSSRQQPSTVTTVKEFRKWRRVHGLQLPLHPQQVLSWVFLVSFTLYIFLTLIPAIHSSAQLPLLVVNVIIFCLHYITHLISLLIDPSDPALLAQVSRRAVPEFDKNKFNHVIENGRCHLCNINISSSRTKHCSVCNKCVHVFDHHCKWLNQCIGRRNYVPFMLCVVSAILMCLSFVSLAVTEMTLYFAKPSLLSAWQHSSIMMANSTSMETTTLTSTPVPDFDSLTTISSSEANRNSTGRSLFINQQDLSSSGSIYQESVQNTSLSYGLIPLSRGSLHLFLFPVSSVLFLIVTGVATLVAMLAAGLLLHLCIFHVYINLHDITTYEYVRAQRQAQEEQQREALAAAANNENGDNNDDDEREEG